MTFGQAIEALKNGQAVSRSGWNGKGMYLYINKGSFPSDKRDLYPSSYIDSIPDNLFESGPAETLVRYPNINMKAATGAIVTGWLASQTDILAEDWDVLPASA